MAILAMAWAAGGVWAAAPGGSDGDQIADVAVRMSYADEVGGGERHVILRGSGEGWRVIHGGIYSSQLYEHKVVPISFMPGELLVLANSLVGSGFFDLPDTMDVPRQVQAGEDRTSMFVDSPVGRIGTTTITITIGNAKKSVTYPRTVLGSPTCLVGLERQIREFADARVNVEGKPKSEGPITGD